MHLHIQDIPDTASILDVQNFFPQLDIPYGSIWILGGVNGDAFVTFRSHEDLSKALMHDGMLLQERPVKLSLSDRNDIENLLHQRFEDLLVISSSDFVSTLKADTAPIEPPWASSRSIIHKEDTREKTISPSLSRPPWHDKPYSSDKSSGIYQDQLKRPAQDIDYGIKLRNAKRKKRARARKMNNFQQDQSVIGGKQQIEPSGQAFYREDARVAPASLSHPPWYDNTPSSSNQDDLWGYVNEETGNQDVDGGINDPKVNRDPTKNIRTVVLADTRGEGLQELFDAKGNKDIHVLAEEETGIEDIVLSKLDDILILQPDVIIITNGICDLTVKDHNTQARRLKHNSNARSIREYLFTVNKVHEILAEKLPNAKVVFSTVTGCDLAICGSQQIAADQQEILDKTVVELNKRLGGMNSKNKVATPWISNAVHKRFKGKPIHNYHYLINGYRLTDFTKDIWVKTLFTCSRKAAFGPLAKQDLKQREYRVLLVTDSRSTNIEKYVDDWENIVLDVVDEPYGGMKAGAEQLVNNKKDESPNAVFVLNGIRDILDRNEHSQMYSFKWQTVSEAVYYYMEQAQEAYNLLRQHFPSVPIAFVSVTGADINKCNAPQRKGLSPRKRYNAPDPWQEVLNAAVVEINREISVFNKAHGIPSMNVALTVHRFIKGVQGSQPIYSLLEDGIHMKETTKRFWAKELKKCIEKVQKATFFQVM